MKPLLPFFLLLFTAAHSLCAQTFKLTDKVFNVWDKYVAEEIYFELGIPKLLSQAYPALDSIANFLLINERITLEVGSHTDSRAAELFSSALTVKRAEVIVDYLINKGVSADRVIAKGYGKTFPRFIYTNTSFFKKGDFLTDEYISKLKTEEQKEEAHQKNRRIELKILKVEPRYFKLTDTVFNVGDVLIAGGIYFDFDKWNIRDESKVQMDSIVDFMNKNNKLVIEIGGYTDSRGIQKYNLELSENRAKAIVKALVKKGIKRKRLKAVGYGDFYRFAENETFEERQMHRRMELKILKTE